MHLFPDVIRIAQTERGRFRSLTCNFLSWVGGFSVLGRAKPYQSHFSPDLPRCCEVSSAKSLNPFPGSLPSSLLAALNHAMVWGLLPATASLWWHLRTRAAPGEAKEVAAKGTTFLGDLGHVVRGKTKKGKRNLPSSPVYCCSSFCSFFQLPLGALLHPLCPIPQRDTLTLLQLLFCRQ